MAETRGTHLSIRLEHLKTPLHPLMSISTGVPHPNFPPTLLHYHLLSASELDDLAAYYHQRSPNVFSLQYPLPVVSRWKQPSAISDTENTFLRTQCLRKWHPVHADQMEQHIVNLTRGNATELDGTGPLAVGETDAQVLEAEHKRRRFGRFMGLKGCESPVMDEEDGKMREEMERVFDEELRKKRKRDDEDDMIREKNWGRRGHTF